MLGQLVGKVVGCRSFAAGVGEHMHLQKPHSRHKGHAGFKVILRLAGEAYDDIGGKADVVRTECRAQLGCNIGVLGRRVGAAHGAQRLVTAALQA